MDLLLNPLTKRQLMAIGAGTGTQGVVFHGPSGTGKARAAEWVACRRNCVGDGWDGCPTCVRIGSGTFPDYVRLGPEDKATIGVEQIRQLGQTMANKPYANGATRVVVIEAADTMTPPAQNGLLKLLEEPPEATLFILLTSSLAALLPTVRSRLGGLYFAPVAQDDIASWLVSVHGVRGVDAFAAAKGSHGRPGLAVIALEAATAPERVILADGPLFARLAEAATLAGAKADGHHIATGLHYLAGSALRTGAMDAVTAGKLMLAAEDLRRNLAGGVTLRTALERYVLETT